MPAAKKPRAALSDSNAVHEAVKDTSSRHKGFPTQ